MLKDLCHLKKKGGATKWIGGLIKFRISIKLECFDLFFSMNIIEIKISAHLTHLMRDNDGDFN